MGAFLYLALSGHKKKEVGRCVVAHACNPGLPKAEAARGGSQPRQHQLQTSHHLWPLPARVLMSHTHVHARA